MTIDEFNALDGDGATALVLTAAAVPTWASAVVARRPYPDVAALLAAADSLAEHWAQPEVDAALADHPRIGERPHGSGAAADHSRREQAAVGTAPETVRERVATGNRAYEERFGRIFLIRAAGRSPQEILDELERRLTNDPATEVAEVADQLREIARLRLAGAFA